uniref:RING-type domain-containing protein n=1 Tax=Opuntia streptacantha TaxID=393608 RepID=A0A7C9B2D7_OPUST
MSARVSLGAPLKGPVCSSQLRKMVLDVDLNAPPYENCNEVGTSSHASAVLGVPSVQPGAPPQPIAIDVDSIDDDVILSSPRAFAEAKNNSRRARDRSNLVDVDVELARHVTNNRNKRQRVMTNQPIINCELYVNLEGNVVSGNGTFMARQSKCAVPLQPPPPPPPPPEPTFSCPVCMGPLVEEMSTKCGHIFCKACIKQAIAAQGKCPTCRRRVTMKDTIRIYLPATSLT